MFAFLDVSAQVLWVFRLALGVGGAVFGWLILAPVLRLGIYVIIRKSFSREANTLLKVVCASLLGVLFYLYAPLGGGGGLGWGPGAGGSPGKGPGDGSGAKSDNGPTAKLPEPDQKGPSSRKDENLLVELVYQPMDRFYLRKNETQADTLEEVLAYVQEKKKQTKVNVTIVTRPDSPGNPGPRLRLKKELEQIGVTPTEVFDRKN